MCVCCVGQVPLVHTSGGIHETAFLHVSSAPARYELQACLVTCLQVAYLVLRILLEADTPSRTVYTVIRACVCGPSASWICLPHTNRQQHNSLKLPTVRFDKDPPRARRWILGPDVLETLRGSSLLQPSPLTTSSARGRKACALKHPVASDMKTSQSNLTLPDRSIYLSKQPTN